VVRPMLSRVRQLEQQGWRQERRERSGIRWTAPRGNAEGEHEERLAVVTRDDFVAASAVSSGGRGGELRRRGCRD